MSVGYSICEITIGIRLKHQFSKLDISFYFYFSFLATLWCCLTSNQDKHKCRVIGHYHIDQINIIFYKSKYGNQFTFIGWIYFRWIDFFVFFSPLFFILFFLNFICICVCEYYIWIYDYYHHLFLSWAWLKMANNERLRSCAHERENL